MIFLDALVSKVRDNGVVANKAAHLAVGVDANGRKQVLGIWIETTEGATIWTRVMGELEGPRRRGRPARGLRRADRPTRRGHQRLAAHDGPDLHRPPDPGVTALGEPHQDCKKVTGQLRAIYGAVSEPAARDGLDAWTSSEIRQKHPAVKRQWDTAWEQVIAFFAFRPEVRKVIYTTNTIESIT